VGTVIQLLTLVDIAPAPDTSLVRSADPEFAFPAQSSGLQAIKPPGENIQGGQKSTFVSKFAFVTRFCAKAAGAATARRMEAASAGLAWRISCPFQRNTINV
jgi:hypothetical protein